MTMKKLILTALVLAAGTGFSSAKIRLPEIIGDNMVLRQNSEVNFWGFAKAGTHIVISPDWCDSTFSAVCGSDGEWEASVSTPAGSMIPHRLRITETDSRGKKASDSITLDNILIGEVWFCSGQSNMEMPLDGFWDCPVEGSAEEIALSGKHDGIRMVTIPKTGALSPQSTVGGSWKTCCPENAGQFSAVGYHFAKTLNAVLNIPVGIISCSWGGSSLEGWLPEEIVSGYPDIDCGVSEPSEGNKGWNWDAHTPFIMYNGMVWPLRNYTVSGFLWYQGETNVGRHSTYASRMQTLVTHWRGLWGQGELPFYLVELAPYRYGEGSDGSRQGGISGALLREAQFKAARSIPNSGIVCTNDLAYPYEDIQIHPCRKKEVGQRLAWLALNRAYGFGSIDCEGPVFREMEVVGNEAVLRFDNDRNGFSPWYGLEGFEIAGEDRMFHKAEAHVIPGQKCVKVSSEAVKKPVAVRYGFRDFCSGNLTGARNLPAFPFRTDDWQ